MRSSPSTWSTSKKNASSAGAGRHDLRCRSGSSCPGTARAAVLVERRSPRRRARTRRREAPHAGRRRRAAASVMSLRLRVKIRTSSPSRWTWIAGAVELPLHRRRPDRAERLVDVGRGRRPASAARTRRPEADRGDAAAPSGRARRARGAAEVARQHRRPPHRRSRHLRGPGDRLGHHPVERALAQLPADQRGEHPGSGGGRGPNSCSRSCRRRSCDDGPGRRGQRRRTPRRRRRPSAWARRPRARLARPTAMPSRPRSGPVGWCR